MNYKLARSIVTHVGNIREKNEDNYFFCGKYKEDREIKQNILFDDSSHDEYLFAVFDGMGGYENGEKASLMAAEMMLKYANNFHERIDDYISTTNSVLCDYQKKYKCRMGTTFVSMYIVDNKVYVCNVGDSKAFIIRDDKIYQISEDHTEVQFMIRNGFLSKEDALKHKDRHILTQNLGIFPEELLIEPYCAEPYQMEKNDVYILCSDGLTDMLDNDEILEIVVQSAGTKECIKGLLNEALSKGGNDNITALVVKITE